VATGLAESLVAWQWVWQTAWWRGNGLGRKFSGKELCVVAGYDTVLVW
jgi:hypothetical protein